MPLGGPARTVHGADRAPFRARLGYSARMFAPQIQNWWWTAHPAAH
ncbi:trp operon leader peptide [Streptomyces sp. NPDC055055]